MDSLFLTWLCVVGICSKVAPLESVMDIEVALLQGWGGGDGYLSKDSKGDNGFFFKDSGGGDGAFSI